MVERIFRCCPLGSTAGTGSLCGKSLWTVVVIMVNHTRDSLLETVYVFVFL